MPFFTKSTSSTATPTGTRKVSAKSNTTTTTAITPNTNRDMGSLADAAKPPSTPTAAPEPPSKDLREFEHGRQKAKKTARTHVWRDDKARAQRIKSGELALARATAPLSTAKRTRSGFQAPSQGARPDWEEGWAEDEWLREFVVDDDKESGATKIVRSASGTLEVDLTEFMKPAKARKVKRAVGDFEVLPSVRQVLALDDRLDVDLEIDEPWEHLSLDGEDEKTFSYAEVAGAVTV